jgi:acetyl-CoA acetyltransferase family protein
MKTAVIVDGLRTPFCKAGSTFAGLTAADLGRQVTVALLARTGLDPAMIDHVIFGCVSQPADTANIARVIALRSGIPQHVPALTVHRNCASGMEAVTTAVEKLAAGQGEIFLVGGTESMSHLPLLYNASSTAKFSKLARAKSLGSRLRAMAGFRPRDFSPIPAIKLGLTDPVAGLNMGETAEILAREFSLTRNDQDAYAMRSHHRASAAGQNFSTEMTPVFVNGQAIVTDNGIRPDSSLEALAKLSPVFTKQCGTVTAGNSSQISDGAVALLVMSEERANSLGLEPLGRIERYAYAGCDPRRMGLGPVHAIAKAGRSLADAEVIEINEAFAAQTLAVIQALGGLPDDLYNPNGGAIALGHPVGASGARIILTCLHELKRRAARTGLATLCVGGGQGGAVWLERN